MQKFSEEDFINKQKTNEISSGEEEQLSDISDDMDDSDLPEFIEEDKFNFSQVEQQIVREEQKFQDIDLQWRKGTNDLQQNVNMVNQHIFSTKQSQKSMANPIKYLVSKQKRRYSLNGFNLDLTYITERIIAMGYPAENVESVYRNSMEDVQRFFNITHPGHYKIYNLYLKKKKKKKFNNQYILFKSCSERKYSHDKFNNMVAEFPFDDHQAPTFGLIHEFCLDLDGWFKADEQNVASIHCKAGKGRTGVMICCYMLYNKQFENAYDAMRYYGMIRTKNRKSYGQKGVTIPSQIRYIFYFEKALNNLWLPDRMPNKEVELVKLRIIPVPNLNVLGGCEPWFRIQANNCDYISKKDTKLKAYKNEPYIEFILKGIFLKGDVLLQFFNNSLLKQNQKMFQTWFGCDFFPNSGVVMIDKFMLDSACKDKKHKQFPKDFRIEIHTVQIYKDTFIFDKKLKNTI